jgi:hypothetical protein
MRIKEDSSDTVLSVFSSISAFYRLKAEIGTGAAIYAL